MTAEINWIRRLRAIEVNRPYLLKNTFAAFQ